MRNPYRTIRFANPILALILLLGMHSAARAAGVTPEDGLIPAEGVALAGGAGQETPLQPYGQAVEINPDPAGVFWISDPTAGEIRSLDPVSNSMVVYPVGGLPSDARANGAGQVWWANNAENKFSRLTIASRTIHTWTIPEAGRLNKTALDSRGGLWLTDLEKSSLFYMNSAGTQVCRYTLPVIARSAALLLQGERVWLADTVNGQIGYLDLNADPKQFTWWSLTPGRLPTGLALDENNRLWWADPQQGELARLDPDANVVTIYAQSSISHPTKLALADGLVWFTDQAQFGVLDPGVAQGETLNVESLPMAADEECFEPIAPEVRTIPTTPGTAEWIETTLGVQPAPRGWWLIALPEGANLQGIAIRGEETWLVDQGRQVVVKVAGVLETKLYLPILRH